MSIIRKETSMIKATIRNQTKRNAFAKANAKKIGSGICQSRPIVGGLVLDSYKLIASGNCSEVPLKQKRSNVILFDKQKEVA